MANPKRGEVSLEVEGKAYTLKFSTNAICELEDRSGKGINEFAQGLNDPGKFRISDLRVMIWVMLGNQVETLEAAGNLIDEIGMEEVVDKVAKAFQLAFPDEKGGDGTEGKQNQAA